MRFLIRYEVLFFVFFLPFHLNNSAYEKLIELTITPQITPQNQLTFHSRPVEQKKPSIAPAPTKQKENEVYSLPYKDNAWTIQKTSVYADTSENSVVNHILAKNTGVMKISSGQNEFCEIQYENAKREIETGYILSEELTFQKPAVTVTPVCEKVDNFEVYPGMLVNFNNALCTKGTPENLVEINSVIKIDGFKCSSNVMANKEAVVSLEKMCQEMKKEKILNISISSTGAYRSYKTQDSYTSSFEYGDVFQKPVRAQLATGSEHRTGLCFDLTAETKVYKWIAKNGADYGFIKRYSGKKSSITGIIDEPWHFTYVGEPLAHFLTENGLCLEEFYEQFVITKVPEAIEKFPELIEKYEYYQKNNMYKKVHESDMIYGTEVHVPR